MALIKCSECGAEVSDKAAACVKCGAPIISDRIPPLPTITETPKTGSSWSWVWWVAGLFFGLLLLSSIFSARTPQDDAKSKARALISKCWDDQKRKSLDPAAARYLAGMCEKFEDDFRQAHGHNP